MCRTGVPIEHHHNSDSHNHYYHNGDNHNHNDTNDDEDHGWDQESLAEGRRVGA
jgi:hypothetical protein